MAGPRFLLFGGVALPEHLVRDRAAQPEAVEVPTRRALPTSTEPANWTAWRLLGRNNRELGRSPAVFSTVPECVAAVDRLKAVIGEAVRLLSVDDRDGRWCWRLVVDGAPVAVSSRSYHRQRECVYNLEQFIVAVADAETPVVTRELPSRGTRGVGPPDDEEGRGGPRVSRRPLSPAALPGWHRPSPPAVAS